jgi:hypothetical protein
MVKDDAEIDALRRAGQAIDRVHARMGEFLKVGRTEAEVAADITAAILDDLYATWVGSGRPEPEPRDEPGDLTHEGLAELDAQVGQVLERLIVIPEGATEDEIEALIDGIEGSLSTVTSAPGETTAPD